MSVLFIHDKDDHYAINTKQIDKIRVGKNAHGQLYIILVKYQDNGSENILYSQRFTDIWEGEISNCFKVISEFVYLGVYEGKYVPTCNLSVTIGWATISYELMTFIEQQTTNHENSDTQI